MDRIHSNQILNVKVVLLTPAECYRPPLYIRAPSIYTVNHKKRDILYLTITLANFD